MVLFHLLLLLIPVSSKDENCPGWCGDPVEEIKLWTDNSHIWRCELPSVVVLPCADDAYISCRRLDDLGGDLYLMLFADSPDNIGIDPDFLSKGRIDTLRTVIQCKDGKWTLPNSTIQMTHILCDQYIINKTKAEESPFKPLPFKPEVVTSTISEVDESTENEHTSITSTSPSTKMTMEDLGNLEATAHNATGSTTAAETSTEIPRNTTATNFIAIEITMSSTDIPKTTRMSSSTNSTSSAEISNSKVSQSTTTIFFNSTTTSQSQQQGFESFSEVTVKYTTLAMTTTPMPSFTISSTNPMFQPSSSTRTTTQATSEVISKENELNISKMTMAITSIPKPAEQTPTLTVRTTSTTSSDLTPSGKPVPKIALKPTTSTMGDTSTLRFMTKNDSSTMKLLTPMQKTTATAKIQRKVPVVNTVTNAPRLQINSTNAFPKNQITETTTTIIISDSLNSTTSPYSALLPEITIPEPAYVSNATNPILVLLVETVLPTNTSNIPSSTTTSEVTATTPQQDVSAPVPTTATELHTSTAKRKTTIPSTTAFEPEPIIILSPTTTEQLPTTSQQSSEQISPADIQILIQPDPYDSVIEPVVIVEKLVIPRRQSRSGGIRTKKTKLRKQRPKLYKKSPQSRPQKGTRKRVILARPQKRQRQNGISKIETKSRRRQHVERKTL